MDVTVQYVNPVKEGLIRPDDWEPLWSKSKQCGSTVGNLAAELGSALGDALVLLSISAPPLEGRKACCFKKDIPCGEVILDQEQYLGMTLVSNSEFGENASSPHSSMMSCDAHANGEDKISNTGLDKKCSFESSNRIGSSVMSLPTSSKLVSAMKGSREECGLHVEKLSVSWAADVYDPPSTSQSHTVKSHNQYSSTMSKKSYRNKNKHKAKSSPKGTNDKKKNSKSRNSSKVASY